MDAIEKQIIEEIEIWSDRDEIRLDDNLLSVMEDESDLIALQYILEDKFGFEIDSLDGDLERVTTVSDLVNLVKSRLNEGSFEEQVPQKQKPDESKTIKTDEKKPEKIFITTNESPDQSNLDCEIFMQAATPDIYRINAFRISGLNVNASNREISSQVQKNQMIEKYGGKMDNQKSPFPIEPPPDIDKLRQALHRLRDPETRIIDEFFWFWPHSIDNGIKDHALEALSGNDIKTAESLWVNYESTLTESNVSRHNLAVLSHLLALDIELNGKDLAQDEIALRDKCWKETYKRWKLLLEHEGFWSRLNARVRQMEDPRLTTGFVRRMRASLPHAILQINGMMAVDFAGRGKEEEAKRQLDLIRTSGFESAIIERALRTAVDPVRQRIKVFSLSACEEAEKNNFRGIEFGRQILTQTQNPLRTLKILLPEKNLMIEGAEDDIINNVFNCYLKYVNKTDDYVSALEFINSIKNFVESDASKARIDEKVKLIEGILEYSNFWRLKGYYSYPSHCVERMETAYNMEEAQSFDEAIDFLRIGLNSLPEIQESDSLRNQFLHCIAFCLRRKAVKIYNEAFSEEKQKFNNLYNSLVKYRTSTFGDFINCAHCCKMIYGTYYTRTVNGTKAPFCDTCNDRIDRDLKDLKEGLERNIKKAFDIISLSRFLSPNHHPTKLDYEVIKGTADEHSIRSGGITDLLLKYNLLDIPETIKLLTSPGGPKDPKLSDHLISVLESQDAEARILTLKRIINNHSDLLKHLQPYLVSNEIIYSDFVKLVFDGGGSISEDRRREILNLLLQEDNYNIWLSLLMVPCISKTQQNIVESIVNRLIEFIHKKVAGNSPNEISFKYGELGDIIQTAAQISEDLKKDCIRAIISAASGDVTKALRIISAIYEERQAEQVFFQILYSNDPIFEKELRTRYYENLLAHWDAGLRKKSIEWLNANITDNKKKIRYLIKSLADPDTSIQLFASDQIKKYPEESTELLIEASYAKNSAQFANIRTLLITILSNHNRNFPKAISLSSLLKICLGSKDDEIPQLTLNLIEKMYPDWMSREDVKSWLKNIKYIAKSGKGINSRIAAGLLSKMKKSGFVNRLRIAFSAIEQFDTPKAPDWCEFVILEKSEPSDKSTFISSGNIAEDLFKKLRKHRHQLKPFKISGFSKVCYNNHISPDGSVLVLTVFKEKGYVYDFDKEKRNLWDLFSLDLNSGNLKRLFYIQDLTFSDVVMLGNSCYASEPTKKIVGWNWRETNEFNFINVNHGIYNTYPKRLNNDLLIEEYNGTVEEYFSLNNGFKKINLILTKGEHIEKMHESKNYILISKHPLDSSGWENYDAPERYLLVSFNDYFSDLSRKEVLKESFKDEISKIGFYGDNHIIYQKKCSKNSKKSDIYLQDLDNSKNFQKVIPNVNAEYVWLKPGYILYIDYNDYTKSRDMIMLELSSGESIKLLSFTGDGYRGFCISDDWSTLSYLKLTKSGEEDDTPCNIYLVYLDPDSETRDQISVKTENNSYVAIGNSKK